MPSADPRSARESLRRPPMHRGPRAKLQRAGCAPVPPLRSPRPERRRRREPPGRRPRAPWIPRGKLAGGRRPQARGGCGRAGRRARTASTGRDVGVPVRRPLRDVLPERRTRSGAASSPHRAERRPRSAENRRRARTAGARAPPADRSSASTVRRAPDRGSAPETRRRPPRRAPAPPCPSARTGPPASALLTRQRQARSARRPARGPAPPPPAA